MRGATRLRTYIEAESSALLKTLRVYVARAGISDQPLDAAASDLLNDVVVEALAHEDRFRATGSPRAWLLGIAANLIHRRSAERARRERREPLIGDLASGDDDDALFDYVAALDPRADEDTISGLLTTLSPEDQRVIRLAILADMDGDAVARELGITPGAARVRLHRALARLRVIYGKANQNA
ncbi:MAG: sigma-70 family RNA polymerase sigma factor [Anaerolinea sp.]|nr:sigma-70 family RNA polymerase sigma factor [Anaerolinea sp.]